MGKTRYRICLSKPGFHKWYYRDTIRKAYRLYDKIIKDQITSDNIYVHGDVYLFDTKLPDHGNDESCIAKFRWLMSWYIEGVREDYSAFYQTYYQPRPA